jgi:anaerobic ribonucleoside-triphosphate reductase activating protein
MYVFAQDDVIQEVPGEISIAFSVAGCPLNCKGCSWKDGVINNKSYRLDLETFTNILKSKSGFATCVVFLGGDWEEELSAFLDKARDMGFKTCLYTGLDSLNDKIMSRLDFVKLGPWVAGLGGLTSPETNQIFMDVNTGENLNHLFISS